LTKEDIATADYVILAVDKEIDTSRFAGKKIKKVSTSRAIKEADVVIEETISGKGLISLEAKSSDISSEQPSKA
ncbi:PTS fructose transporter subunit IIBC, partial [Escherichia coli]|nr:PTS fructose transporter subunit IIBC [Escherichia coli]